MNLDQLRPCDACGGAVNPVFFRLRVDQQVVNQDAVRERAGMLQFFRGNMRLASVFDARGETATGSVSVTEVILCTTCFCSSVELAGAWEQRCKAVDPASERGAS